MRQRAIPKVNVSQIPKWRSVSHRVLVGMLYMFYLVLVFEIGSRIFFSLGTSHQSDPSNNFIFRMNWKKRHKANKLETNTRYIFDVYHPVRGWTTKPNVSEMRVFKDEKLNTNSRGLRGKLEYTYARTAGKKRVVLLGDSFTFGEDVSDSEIYAALLEDHFEDLEIINLGVHGYGHDQMLLYLKEEGVKYQPDIVMLGFVAADMSRNRLSFRDYAKPYFKIASDGTLHLRNVPVPTPEEVLSSELFRLKFIDALGLFWIKVERRLGWLWEYEQAITASLLDEIAGVSRDIGAEPLLVFLPAGNQTYEDVHSKHEAFFEAYCARQQIRCYNLRPHFIKAAAEGIDFGRVFHWNERGHKIVADGLASYLVNVLHLRPRSTFERASK